VPREGYRTITIKESVYNKFREDYEKNKDELRLRGIPSFTSYCIYLLNKASELNKKHD
jgi:hypothetical protein